ncbi:MAG: hypothetical protein ACOC1K_02830 [Nanoarchaeota archaeon]
MIDRTLNLINTFDPKYDLDGENDWKHRPVFDKFSNNMVELSNEDIYDLNYNEDRDTRKWHLNTQLVFNVLNNCGMLTTSAYLIYAVCCQLNNKINVRKINKFLKKHKIKPPVYQTTRKSLDELIELGYLKEYTSKYKKLIKLSDQVHNTNRIIYGENNNNEFFKLLSGAKFPALGSLRKMPESRWRINTKTNKRDYYIEYTYGFNFFEKDKGFYNYKNVYLQIFSDFTFKHYKRLKYKNWRDFINEELVARLWFNVPVTNYNIKRILHTTDSSIRNFVNRSKINTLTIENEEQYKTDSILNELYVPYGCIRFKDEFGTKLYSENEQFNKTYYFIDFNLFIIDKYNIKHDLKHYDKIKLLREHAENMYLNNTIKEYNSQMSNNGREDATIIAVRNSSFSKGNGKYSLTARKSNSLIHGHYSYYDLKSYMLSSLQEIGFSFLLNFLSTKSKRFKKQFKSRVIPSLA